MYTVHKSAQHYCGSHTLPSKMNVVPTLVMSQNAQVFNWRVVVVEFKGASLWGYSLYCHSLLHDTYLPLYVMHQHQTTLAR